MAQIETSTTVKKFPKGGKIVKIEPLGPVRVTRVRTVGVDKQTVELQLEQTFPQPVGGQGGVLALTMQGHSAFNSGPRRRLTWQNFSIQQAIKFGVIRSWDEVAESEGPLSNMPDAPLQKGILIFPNGGKKLTLMDDHNKEIPLKLVEVETFTARSWTDSGGIKRTQKAKSAGANGDLLTFDGQPIYRNSGLSMPGADDILMQEVDGKDIPVTRKWDEDLVIIHNNAIVGSSVRTAMNAAHIPTPQLPGGKPAGYQGDPTRHTPDEQLVEVADKTLAEEQREAGERSPIAGQG